METEELESRTYQSLIGDERLMGELTGGANAVFHVQAPAMNYPCMPIIVYSAISDVPVLHGDDNEKLHRVIMRIHIITEDGAYAKIYKEVKRVMSNIGFSRLQTTPLIADGKRMLVTDFRILIGGREEWRQSD